LKLQALFDINVLIALLEDKHIHHTRATHWLSQNGHLGCKSCAITINGCARIMSNSGYPDAEPLAHVLLRLNTATKQPIHSSIETQVSVLDSGIFEHSRMHSAAQLTDIYLLGLAAANACRLITFDKRVPIESVKIARAEHLVAL
jgi:uncharacterized protein